MLDETELMSTICSGGPSSRLGEPSNLGQGSAPAPGVSVGVERGGRDRSAILSGAVLLAMVLGLAGYGTVAMLRERRSEPS